MRPRPVLMLTCDTCGRSHFAQRARGSARAERRSGVSRFHVLGVDEGDLARRWVRLTRAEDYRCKPCCEATGLDTAGTLRTALQGKPVEELSPRN